MSARPIERRYPDTSYEYLLEKLYSDGEYRPDRTGTGANSLFGESLSYNMANGFPLITTKRVHFKSVVGELLWFLSGSTNALELEEEYGVTIWREWMDKDGELGPVYGAQWRNFGGYTLPDGAGIDQITNVIKGIKEDPFGRRHIVSAWNPNDLQYMALPPCHMMFQFWVGSDADGKPKDISLHLYQRSADMFLGVPFNIASYALLLEMVAQQVDLPTRDVKLTFGDAHLYRNHHDVAAIQMERQPFTFPTLTLDPVGSIFDHTPETIHLTDYTHHGVLRGEVAV